MTKIEKMIKPLSVIIACLTLVFVCICYLINANNVSFVQLNDNEQKVLSAGENDNNELSYQWKVVNPQDLSSADILGANSKDLAVDSQMFNNIKDVFGNSYLYCDAYDNAGNKVNSWSYVASQSANEQAQAQENKSPNSNAHTVSVDTAKSDNKNDTTYKVTLEFYKGESFETASKFDEVFVDNLKEHAPLNWLVELHSSIGTAKSISPEKVEEVNLQAKFVDDSKSHIEISTISNDPDKGVVSDYTFKVLFSPQDFNYNVQYWHENADTDGYSLHETKINSNKVDTEIPTEEDFINYDGMYQGSYESSQVSARNTETVAIYYNRNYYLSKFDLQGGINGQTAIFGKYGAKYPEITKPTRDGYTFKGWFDAPTGGNQINFETETIPNETVTYYAQWTEETKSASVNVVIWGQNAEDDNYSYIETKTVSGQTVGNIYKPTTATVLAWTDPASPQTTTSEKKYSWRWSCKEIEDNVIVTPDNKAVCNIKLDRLLFGWTFKSGTSSTAVSYTIKDRWGKNIYDCTGPSSSEGAQIDKNYKSICNEFYGKDSGYFKTNAGISTLYLQIYYNNQKDVGSTYLPDGDNRIKNSLSGDIKLIFLKQKVDSENNEGFLSEDCTSSYTGDDYIEAYSKIANQAWGDPTSITPIAGFVTPSIKATTTVKGYRPSSLGNKINNLFYLRESYNINLYSTEKDKIESISIDKQKFERTLDKATYTDEKGVSGNLLINYVPKKPATVDKNYVFKGWCSDTACNVPFDWKNPDGTYKIMPASELTLFAKWGPADDITVNFYKDKSDIGSDPYAKVTDQTLTKLIEDTQVPVDPEKEHYDFNGWFYMDGDEEKAFDPSTMAIDIKMTGDETAPTANPINLYAKWNATDIVPYKVLYKLGPATEHPEEAVDVAAERHGAATIGSTINLIAKAGLDLDLGYKDSYVPDVDEISITLQGSEEENTRVFWYNTGTFNYQVKHFIGDSENPFETNNYSTANSMVTVLPKADVEDSGKKCVSNKTQVTINMSQQITKVVEFRYYPVPDEKSICYINYYTLDDPETGAKTLLPDLTQTFDVARGTTIDPVPRTISGYEFNQTWSDPYSGTIQLNEPVKYINYCYNKAKFNYTARAISADMAGGDYVFATVEGQAEYNSEIGHSVFNGQNFLDVCHPVDARDYFTIASNTSSNKHDFLYREDDAEYTYNVNKEGYGKTLIDDLEISEQKIKSWSGTTKDVVAVANDGYAFVKWVDKDGETVSTDATLHHEKCEKNYYVGGEYKAVFASAWELLQTAAKGDSVINNSFFTITDQGDVRTITLNSDILLNDIDQDLSQIVILQGKNIVINLNGHKIDRNLASSTQTIENGRVILNNGNLTIKDTSQGENFDSITGGKCSENGGAIYSTVNATLHLENCNIESNVSSGNGAGIYAEKDFSISGKVVVANNKSGEVSNNVYLSSGVKINVENLDANSLIGITSESFVANGSPACISENCSVNMSNCYVSDNAEYCITTLNKTNGIYLDAYEFAGGKITGYKGTITAANIQIPYTINSESVTGINTLFAGNISLEGIVIPDSVSAIEDGAFAGCTNLVSFTVDENNPTYKASNDKLMLLSHDGATLYSYPSAKGEVSTQSGITTIHNLAFSKCSTLSSITFADTLSTIEVNAFNETSNLTSVKFLCDKPAGVENVVTANRDAYYYTTDIWCASAKPVAKAWHPMVVSAEYFRNYLASEYTNSEIADISQNLDFSSSSKNIFTSNVTKKLNFVTESTSLNIGNNAIEVKTGSLSLEKGTITGHIDSTANKASKIANDLLNNSSVEINKVSNEPSFTSDTNGNLRSANGSAQVFDGTIIRVTSDTTLNISGTKFDRNSMTYGCIYNNGTANITNCSFTNNNSTYSEKVEAWGGSCLYNSGTAIVTDTTFVDNKAVCCGGSIINVNDLTLNNCEIKNGFALYGGGIYNTVTTSGKIGKLKIKTVEDGITSIKGNTATKGSAACGGGIYNAFESELDLDGYIEISENTNGLKAIDNLCLANNSLISISSLASSANIGINLVEMIKGKIISKPCTNDYSAKFSCDNENFKVVFDNNDKCLKLDNK